MSFMTSALDPLVVTGRPPLWKVIAYFGVLVYAGMVSHRMRKWHRALLLLGACAFMLILPTFRRPEGLEVTFLYVGVTMLVDTGPAGMGHDAASTHLLPFLMLKGVSRLDVVAVTHSHNDHYGGLNTISDNLEIGEVLVGSTKGESAYTSCLDGIRSCGIPVRTVRRGDTLKLGEVVIEVLHPSEECLNRASDPNAESVVFILRFMGRSMIFTGDVTPGIQEELTELDENLSCEVIKVPHHGAPGALNSGFLRMVAPEYAVISAGSRFRSHPDAETIQELEASGACVFTTRTDGAITITTDGQSLEVRSHVGGRHTPDGKARAASRIPRAVSVCLSNREGDPRAP
jgi:competence protein ComEC